MATVKALRLDREQRVGLLKDQTSNLPLDKLPANKTHKHPDGSSGDENATIFFIGTATTIIEWEGIRILTDPNFLHAGDHVHLGPGVNATRQTDPALDLHDLPPVDCILLSHYHEDHFDRLVEDSLNRAFPIITTPHARGCLTSKTEPFTQVTSLGFFESSVLDVGSSPTNLPGWRRVVKVTGAPGKHVPPGPLSTVNDFLKAVPPTNGWLLELGYTAATETSDKPSEVDVGYRIYISGDTLFVDELKEIPKRLSDGRIDLMLVHLGGTTIPGPNAPLFMVTMDANQGLQLMQCMDPDVTIPIHYDDYDVFLSPLSDFKEQVDKAGYQKRVVYLDRGEAYDFTVKHGSVSSS